MSGAVDLSSELRLWGPLPFFRTGPVWTGISGWLPAGFCDGGRCRVGRNCDWPDGGGGTDAGTKVGASGCNRVNCPPKDLPPATALSCDGGLGFGRLPEEGPTPPPRPRLRFLGLWLSKIFCAGVVAVAPGMADGVARAAIVERRLFSGALALTQRPLDVHTSTPRAMLCLEKGSWGRNGGFKKIASWTSESRVSKYSGKSS
jgi:hypothetical protein